MEIHHQPDTPSFSPGTFIAEIDGSKAQTLRAFYPRIAKQLFFPDYFGKNLDALADCLCSLEVTGSAQVVLFIRNFDQFLSKEKPERRNAAIAVLTDAENEDQRLDGITFNVVGVI